MRSSNDYRGPHVSSSKDDASWQVSQSPRFRALIATLTLAMAAALWLPMSVAEAGGPRHRPKPTVVLVHGAWADSSSWSEVVRRLQSDGYTVEVPPNPLRGLVGDAAYLSAYLQTIVGPIVLVGHSYGGAVITNAASGNMNVKALVFVNAFIPDQGETVVQLASAQPGSALAVADPTTVFRLVPYPGSPPGDFDAYILPAVFVDAFANDLPPRTGRSVGRNPASGHPQRLGDPVRNSCLAFDPELGPGRDPGPGATTSAAVRHGRTGPRSHRQGGRIALVDDLQAQRGRRPHSRGLPGHGE